MKDLRFTCYNGNRKMSYSYNTIMDFTDKYENSNSRILTYTNVDAIFFENKHNTKHVNNVAELLTHCLEIIK